MLLCLAVVYMLWLIAELTMNMVMHHVCVIDVHSVMDIDNVHE